MGKQMVKHESGLEAPILPALVIVDGERESHIIYVNYYSK